ncbi:uncharacterized protein LOC135074835 [Ostrinia nubilalis]|uniref:uncharacterized protein LOC135074835 n=1 Tax=Ostrinia nubilalis TaxID=29057 RepID=UPI00308230FB
MSTNNLSSVMKSCSESELINEVSDAAMTPKQVEGSRLKRTFTLPRNPFGTAKPTSSKNKVHDTESKPTSASSIASEPQKDEGGIERKLFRRPSWKRFLNKIAQHMSTVNVSGVKSPPAVMNGERVPCSGDPPWPPGATPAATGIKNHGNTCYMNAVLQCLSHTDVIAEYFVLDHYKVDLQKRNKINSKKYGTRGEVTEQLAALLKALWACHYTPDMSTMFKGAVERHGTQYRGNSQHDAQEFLFWLLDKVHEDLNTATKKKYKTIKNTCGKPDEVVAAETLANHARRNSSFVQAVFQAQYRSALTCAKCERTSCTFDPFHCVSVQLPSRLATVQPSPLPVNVVYVNQQPRQVRIGVELTPTATMDDLRTTLHTDTGIDRDHIILAEINETGWCNARAGWEVAGMDFGALYCMEAPPLLQTPTTPYLLILWVNLLDGERFGSPYAMQVPREISYEDLQKLMLKEMSQVIAERVLEDAQAADIFRARIAEAHRPRDPAYLQPELMLKEMSQVIAERVLEDAQAADIFRARIAEAHRPRDPAYLQPELMLKEMSQVIAERVLEDAQAADIFRARIAEAHRPRDPAYLQPELMLKEMSQVIAERVLEDAQAADIFRARIAEAHRPRDPAYLQPELMLKEMSQVIAERVLEDAQAADIFRARIAEAHRPRDPAYLQPELMLKEMSQVIAERVLEDAQAADIFRARIAEAHRPRDPRLPAARVLLHHPEHGRGVRGARVGGGRGAAHAARLPRALHARRAPGAGGRLEVSLRSTATLECCYIIRSMGEACEVHVSAAGAAGAAPLTLHACLAHYTRAEHLAQEDAWRCPQCQRYMPVVKTLGLWSLPDILVIHLKRFRQQAKGRTSTKLTTMVEFPLNDFDMTPHLVRRNSTGAESPSHSRSPRRRHSKTPAGGPNENMYDLYAICYHHGDDLETGHYTAACKNPYDGHWYKFDDSRVTAVEDEDAYSELVNNTAYMLFYRRKRPNVTHSCSADDHNGHWALRMPKYVRQKPEVLTEVKEENADDPKIEVQNNEAESESDVTAPTNSPLSRSVESLPDDSMAEPPPPVIQTTTVVHNASIIQSPTLQRPLIVEVNGNRTNDDPNENDSSASTEPYIHKDVHVNPKMTPVDTRRPRSVDYPARGSAAPSRDANRNYESSPLVASINGVEYHPTTEELMLSMFQESKYIVPRHGNHITGESHRTGEKSSVWKTRIST